MLKTRVLVLLKKHPKTCWETVLTSSFPYSIWYLRYKNTCRTFVVTFKLTLFSRFSGTPWHFVRDLEHKVPSPVFLIRKRSSVFTILPSESYTLQVMSHNEISAGRPKWNVLKSTASRSATEIPQLFTLPRTKRGRTKVWRESINPRVAVSNRLGLARLLCPPLPERASVHFFATIVEQLEIVRMIRPIRSDFLSTDKSQ